MNSININHSDITPTGATKISFYAFACDIGLLPIADGEWDKWPTVINVKGFSDGIHSFDVTVGDCISVEYAFWNGHKYQHLRVLNS